MNEPNKSNSIQPQVETIANEPPVVESSLTAALSRREVIALLGTTGVTSLITIAGCSGGGSVISPTPTPAPTATPTPVGASPTPTPTPTPIGATPTPTPTATPTPSPTPTPSLTCSLLSSETDGPFPLYSVLNSSFIRSNITEGKTGVPLTLTINLVDVNNVCGPIQNAYVYIWHCDKDGAYSGYSGNGNGSHTGETFLRGIQQTDSSGKVTFQTIYPGWYNGRITHIHAQVYVTTLTHVQTTPTTQFAFPQDITAAVYNSPLYAAHGQNTSVTSFSGDNVFSDGVTKEMLTISGSVAAGYTASITIGISR